METAPWLFVEVGGSSIQTAQRDPAGRFWFTPGLVRDPGRPIALACPGLIRDGRVLYATNLGWPDEAEPGRELGVGGIGLVVNDAEAAAVGESVLRAGDAPTLDLLYVTLGTGVGSARVCDGAASYLDLAHRHVGGTNYCAGCRSVGCLNSLLESRRLPLDGRGSGLRCPGPGRRPRRPRPRRGGAAGAGRRHRAPLPGDRRAPRPPRAEPDSAHARPRRGEVRRLRRAGLPGAPALGVGHAMMRGPRRCVSGGRGRVPVPAV